MRPPLGESNTRRLLLAAALSLSLFLIEQASWIWRAHTDIDAKNLDAIARGAQLIPGDAEGWDRLGRFRQWNFEHPDPAGAVQDYRRAVRDLPLSSYYWMDLAEAYEQTGDLGRADQAFRQAEADYPISGGVAWNYGNFLLREKQVAKGLEEIHRAVASDPRLLPLAISRVWRSNPDVNVLVGRVLPANLAANFQALAFFQSIGDADAGLAVWNKVLSLGKPFELPQAFPLVDQLIRLDRANDATKVWLEAIRACAVPHRPPPHSSLIWNGEFTGPFANGGLGWRWDAPLGVAINFGDPRTKGGASRSVRLDFNGGNNIQLQSPAQYVPVEPNSVYHFRGYLKTRAISTESGMQFSITDPNHPGAVDVATVNLTGTHPWTRADADITTGPQTHFLLVRLYRAPSRLFDNQLSGTAWMADVSLVPSAAEQERAKP